MGACLCKQTRALPQTAAPRPDLPPPAATPCPDLPPELAGLVFCRLPSHDDRRSFRAVCHAWRLAAQQQIPLPPAMPCINLGASAYQSLIDGKVRRFRMPEGYQSINLGSHAHQSLIGGWLLYRHERSGRCFLRAPSSCAAIEVPAHCHKTWVDFLVANVRRLRLLQDVLSIGGGMYVKMIVCSSNLFVAIFGSLFSSPSPLLDPVTCLASFRPQQHPHDYKRPLVGDYIYTDIAFYNEKVFALSSREELFCYHVDGETINMQQAEPIVRHINGHPATDLWVNLVVWSNKPRNKYLVVSSNKEKLLMVRWRMRSITADDHRAMDLWVYEADFGQGRWAEVTDLEGQVLFLSRSSSMAFAAGSSEHWGPRFRGGNRVVVLGSEWARTLEQPVSGKTDIPSYCVYDMTSGETTLVSLDGPRCMESSMSGWFFPLE